MALFLPGLVGPVRASPADVILDANSISTNDVVVDASGSFTRQFAVGIVITGVTPTDFIDNLFGFQFVVNFDPTKLTAQGAPPAVTLPNTPTVQFGTLAPHNWQGFINAFQAAAIVNVNNTAGRVDVGYTLFDPAQNPPRDITAPTILARVNFEIDTSIPSPGTDITLSDVILANELGVAITQTSGTPGGNPINTGGTISEVVTNNPPVASFTFTPTNPVPPDASGTTMVSFDATASSDSDGTITNYVWDFGDGNGEQDMGVGPFQYGLVGLGKFNVTLRVVDNSGATGAARDLFTLAIVDDQPSHTFQTVVIDTPPVLAPIGGQTVDEEVELSFTATASDPDAGQTLTFSLVDAPTGATIDPVTGVFVWTPTEAQGPGSFNFDVRVTDSLDVSDSETITVTVNEVNNPPLLGAIGDRNVNEEASLTFTVTATDPDIPANTLTLSATGLPTGATFNPATGQFSWTPTEAQGPGTFTLTFTATDTGTPPLSDPETITVTVAEVNKPPVLSVPGAETVTAGSLLTFTITATDPDTPTNTLAITVSGLPTGATFDPATGVFSWTPSVTGDFTVTFTATDNGSPATSETRTVSVQVGEAPSVITLPIIAGGIVGVIILLLLLWQFVLKKRSRPPASPSPPTKSFELDWRLPERTYSLFPRLSAARQSGFFSRTFLTGT